MSDHRRLSAILFADIQGYTALMQTDEKKGMTLLNKFQTTLKDEVNRFGGEIVKNYGDGSICLFPTSLSCVECGKAVQESMMQEPVVPLRIGLHEGDVTLKEGDVYGDAVNVASRIESMGVSGNVLLSRSLYQMVNNQAELQFQSLGQFHFKNVTEPMEVFALANEGFVVPERKQLKGKFEVRKKSYISVIAKWTLLALILGVLGTAYWMYKGKKVEDFDPFQYTNSLAFLSLEDISPSGDQQFLGDAIITEMITLMSQVPGLKVIGQNSSFYYKDKDIPLKEIGEILDVNYLVDGSFTRKDDALQLNLFLLDAKSGEVVKPFKIKTDLDDLFAEQEQLALHLAGQIKMTLREDFFTMEKHPNIEAYLLTQKAWHLIELGKTQQEHEEIERLLLQSLDIDSSYLWTLALLSSLYSDMSISGVLSPEVGYSKSKYYSEKLAKLDSTSIISLFNRAMRYEDDLEYTKTVEALEKMLLSSKLDVRHVSAAGFHLGPILNMERGIRLCENALERDPLYVLNYRNLFELYMVNEEYEKAMQMYDKIVTLDSLSASGLTDYVSIIHSLKGEFQDALTIANQVENEMWRFPAQFLAHYGLGERKEALEILDQYTNKYSDHDPYYIASCFAFMNDSDNAFFWLDKAVDQKATHFLRFLKVDPLFKNIRSDQRWIPLLRRLKFPEPLLG